MKICIVCKGEFPAKQPHQKLCGDACRRLFQSEYQHAYHVANLEKRREFRRLHMRKYSRENRETINAKRRLRPLTEKQKQRRRERERLRKMRPDVRAALAAQRQRRRDKIIKDKRRYYARHREILAERQRQRRDRPEVREHIRHKARHHAAKLSASWKILRELAKHDETFRSIVGELNDLA